MGSEKNNKTERATGLFHGARLLCLELDEVETYERNPRTTRNPEYERIRQSIESRGLEQPLIVTRRPGDDGYIVKAGGNTRLQILKDLYQNTSDPEYATVHCIEVGWEDEASVLIGHLKENNLRGALSFADQAAAVCAFAELLSEEQQAARPSIRDLQDLLKVNGLPISVGSLSRMRYAAEFLIPVMPVALSDGMGHRAVARIRKLHRAGAEAWQQHDLGPDTEFDDIFAELCRRNDGPDWQLEPLQRAVESEIAEAADTSLQVIRFELEYPDTLAEVSCETEPSIPEHQATGDLPLTALELNRGDSIERGVNDQAGERMQISISLNQDRCEPGSQQKSTNSIEANDPFLDLRRRAYGIADGIACRFRMYGLVMPLPDSGYGFLVGDIPDIAKQTQDAGGPRAVVGTMWWQLLAFSDTACAPVEILKDRLPDASALRTILLDQKLELLFDRITIIDAASIADLFWSQLPQQDWQDWLFLAHTYREIRRKVIETETPLWDRAS